MTADAPLTPTPRVDGPRTRSVSLDVLRVVAILGVVAIHVLVGHPGRTDERGGCVTTFELFKVQIS